MHWEYPNFLLALWLLPVVAWLLVWAERRRAAAAARFAEAAMRGRIMPAAGPARRWVKGSMLVAAIGLLIVAAAGPRFGAYYEKVTQRGAAGVILLDVSRSMPAAAVAPNRLERDKSDIRDLLARIVGDRVGLIVFAGKPEVLVPLTTDRGFFEMMLDGVDTSSAPRGGTLIGDAIRKAIEVMPPRADRDQAIVLITDGEDHESMPKEAAKHAAERGIKIFTVALGDSTEGARVPLRGDDGQRKYLQYAGKEVWSKVDERLLADIALSTGGAYIPAGTKTYDLGQVYQKHLSQLVHGEFRAERRRRYHEQFQWFLCVGLALLLTEMAVPAVSPSRDRKGADMHGESETPLPHGRGSGFLPAAVLLAIVLWPSSAQARLNDVPKKVREGIEHYEAGRFDKAVAALDEARQKRPQDPRITFDAACAKAAAGAAEEAVQLFQQAAVTPDAELAARCHYNLGWLAANRAKAALGEKPEAAQAEARDQAREFAAAAIGHWRDCLAMKPQHADARYNIELTDLWLDHMDQVWKQADRAKRFEKMRLGEMLQWLEAQQRTLREATRELEDREPSPAARLAVHQTAGAQRELSDDVDPLKQKIAQEINQPQPAEANMPGSPGGVAAPTAGNPPRGEFAAMDPGQREHAIKLLSGLADEARQSMRTSAEHLAEQSVGEALASQATAIEHLDQVHSVVTPYPDLVHRAVERQKQLIGETKEPTEAGWRQRFVERWTPILMAKAKQGLANMPPVEAEPARGPTGVATSPGGKTSPAEHGQDAGATSAAAEKPDPQEAARKQQENLRKSMELAVKLGPEVQRLVARAAADLDGQRAADALPKQREALRLLKKIAEPLKQPNKDQQDQDQKNKKDNKDQKQQKEQSKQDKKKDKKDDQQKQDKKDQDKDKGKEKEKDKGMDKPQQKAGQQPTPQQPQAGPPPKPRQQQAEALIPLGRQRDREKQEARKAMKEMRSHPPSVEKDW